MWDMLILDMETLLTGGMTDLIVGVLVVIFGWNGDDVMIEYLLEKLQYITTMMIIINIISIW